MADYPTYRYRPSSTGQPRLRTMNAARARLFAAGTFFRAREVGGEGNRLSIQIINYGGSPREGYLVVTNRNLLTQENVTAPAGVTPQLLRLDIPALQTFTIYDLHTAAPRARLSSDSLQAVPPPPAIVELGQVNLGTPIIFPGIVALKLRVETGTSFSPLDKIVVRQRREVYPLNPAVDTFSTPGWEIPALRASVNSTGRWIHLPPRGYDAQDGMVPGPLPGDFMPPQDDEVLQLSLSETFLAGGSGFPETPAQETTGPARSLVHINYAERDDGTPREVSQVYEWAGESATDGSWVKYQ